MTVIKKELAKKIIEHLENDDYSLAWNTFYQAMFPKEKKMARFIVRWKITLEKEFEGKDIAEIEEQASDMDCQHEGEYISGSFDIISIKKEM